MNSAINQVKRRQEQVETAIMHTLGRLKDANTNVDIYTKELDSLKKELAELADAVVLLSSKPIVKGKKKE